MKYRIALALAAVRQIDPARLKPEPPKDTRPALLGEFD